MSGLSQDLPLKDMSGMVRAAQGSRAGRDETAYVQSLEIMK